MVGTRFICAGDLAKAIYRGETRATENGTPMRVRLTDDELAAIASGATLHVVK